MGPFERAKAVVARAMRCLDKARRREAELKKIAMDAEHAAITFKGMFQQEKLARVQAENVALKWRAEVNELRVMVEELSGVPADKLGKPGHCVSASMN